MPTPNDDLIRWVEQRVEDDPGLDDEVGLLVLAALEGDAELDDYLATGASPRSTPSRVTPEEPTEAATGAFLRSLTVTGFRGIGAAVTVDFQPAPGLTVVAGRNGSGKSSLAEGLEVLLTGSTYRWKNKSAQWSERWRNLHHDGDVVIAADIIEQGAGPIQMRTSWAAATTDVADHTATAQRTTEGRKGPAQDAEVLGWAPLLETYRPMLSYDELGGLLEAGPSALYDALAKALGTEQLTHALARLKARLNSMSAPQRAAASTRRTLQSEAAELDDERAVDAAARLRKTSPDVIAIRSLATGVSLPDSGIVSALRALSQVTSPDPVRVVNAAARLRRAVTAMSDAGEDAAARRVARLDLRRRALHLHTEFGGQSCPVCNQGSLDDAWAQTSRDLVRHEEEELRALSDARAELDAARLALRALVVRRPAPLDSAPLDDLDDLISKARRAWTSFDTAPDGSDLDLADHLELYAEELASTAGEVRAAATAALAQRDDAWGPLASRIAAWCDVWDEVTTQKPMVDRLAAAERWLKENDTRLKNERIAPISDQAKHAWGLLRQESNVDLGDLRLEGSANRRRVDITATIDGEDAGGALPVMSQGELHALALALFLPRACLDESPFRFVVLDDPVQAMDPSKVDGLVALLTEIARDRQVVVFSHDDRLPAALRRSSSSARVLEVVRGADSGVTVTPAEDPTTRYLDDARALCLDDHVPDDTLRRTLPGLLRMAIESAARDRFFAARISRGQPVAEVEAQWTSRHSTRDRVSLAVYDEVRSLDDWLRTESRRKGLGIATRGFHEGLLANTSPADAVHHVRRLVDDVRSSTR